MKRDWLEPPSNPTNVLNLCTYVLQKIEEYSQLLLTLYKTS